MYITNNGKFKEGIVWWDTAIDKDADVDIFFFIHDYDKRAKHSYGFKTLEFNLKQSIDQIISGFHPRLRQELRNIPEGDFKTTFFEELSDELILEHVSGFNSFADFKGLSRTSFELIKSMNEEGKIILVKTYHKDIHVCSHLFYHDGKRARQYHAFSTLNIFDSNINGRANKFTVLKDFEYLKENGFDLFDFGGIGTVSGDNSKFTGIINFKKRFGGEEVILWKGATPNGERGEIIFNKYFNRD